MVWDSRDEANPKSKMLMLIIVWVNFLVVLNFLVGYSSH
jgi:hypothetical protein